MPGWMDEFLNKRTQKQDEKALKASLMAAALASVPKMTRELTEQLKADSLAFATATGIQILTTIIPNGLRVEHGKYPVFSIDIEGEQNVPVIKCTQRTKRTANDSMKDKIIEIPITCDGQNELYYSAGPNAEPGADVAKVSEFLLAPLLEMLS